REPMVFAPFWRSWVREATPSIPIERSAASGSASIFFCQSGSVAVASLSFLIAAIASGPNSSLSVLLFAIYILPMGVVDDVPTSRHHVVAKRLRDRVGAGEPEKRGRAARRHASCR